MGARSPPPCFLARVLRGRLRSLRIASVPVCYSPYAYWPHSYPLLRRAASTFVVVHVSDPRSRLPPWPLPPRCLVVPSLFARSPQHPSFMPLIHSCTCQERFRDQLAGCIGNNRRCLQWLWRVRFVLTNLLSLLRVLQRFTSGRYTSSVSQFSLLSCNMLICTHTLSLTLL